MSGVFLHKSNKQEYNASDDNTPYRTDIVRPISDYDDLSRQVVITHKTNLAIEQKIAPLVARNADNNAFLLSKDWIQELVNNPYGMSFMMFNRMIESIERFYFKNKLTKRLPHVNIISHRSAHFGEGLFQIREFDVDTYLQSTKDRVRNFKIRSVHKILVDGLEPFFIENMRQGKYKYLIVRPKLGKSGAPTPDKWEILFFTTNPGYLIEHIDTDKNPRYNGTI